MNIVGEKCQFRWLWVGALVQRVYLHEFLFGALWADDVLSVGDEALADEWCLALGADEAIVVPVTVFEWDETGAADTWKSGYLKNIDFTYFF